jgi:uncharacterized protein (UPF0333 family)
MDFFSARKEGKVSMTRILSFLVVVTILVIFVAWTIKAMVKGGTLVSLGLNEVYLLAIAMGAKVTQSIFGEKTPASVGEKPKEVPVKPSEPVNGPG